MTHDVITPDGRHRVLDDAPVSPKGAYRLDATTPANSSEIAIAVERLNLDSASYQQLHAKHDGNGDAIRDEVLDIITERGKMQNPVTGSGGMLIGTITHVGADNDLATQLELSEGDRVATLVSLTLTPLRITDGLRDWDGLGEQVPTTGQAILFSRSIAAKLPSDIGDDTALALFDVCGAPKLAAAEIGRTNARRIVVLGAAGKSGVLTLAAAADAGVDERVAVVRDENEAAALALTDLATDIVVSDARDATATAAKAQGADLVVVCVNVPGCEATAIECAAEGGQIIFFSMATSFAEAALGAEGAAKDVRMLIGSGYVPGHAGYALQLYRDNPGVRRIFDRHAAGSAALGDDPES